MLKVITNCAQQALGTVYISRSFDRLIISLPRSAIAMLSNNDLIHISEALSDARMEKYSKHNGDLEACIGAYECGLSLNQALVKPLNITEVALRNALDRALRLWWSSKGHCGSWTDQRAAGLEPALDRFAHRSDWRRRASKMSLVGWWSTTTSLPTHRLAHGGTSSATRPQS